MIKAVVCALLLGMTSVAAAQNAAHQGHGGANAHMNQQSFEQLTASFDSTERDAWQKPATVLAALGDLRGKTVMDIGAGTGYFSFRLAEAGAHVIAADVDERFQEFIERKRVERGLTPAQLELRRIPYDSPALKTGEADMVIIVDTYHHIESRPAYFAKVRDGLKPGGRLVVIDFFRRDLPVGPPVAMKIAETQVMAELQQAGFPAVTVDRELLPYQYIVTAQR